MFTTFYILKLLIFLKISLDNFCQVFIFFDSFDTYNFG